MKKNIVIIFVLVLALVTTSCALNKAPIAAEDFYSKLTELGFNISDLAEQYQGAAINAFLAVDPSENYRIRFIEFTAQAQAESVFSSTGETFEQFSGTSSSFTGKNWASQSKTVGNEFVFIQYIDNIFIFAGGAAEYAQEIKDIVSALEKGASLSPSKISSAKTTETQAPAGVSDFTIYGEWRYVITRSNTGDTYAEESLSSSVLRIFEIGNNINVEFTRGTYIYYGDLREINDNVYRFFYLSLGEYQAVDTIIFDPAAKRLGLEDGESGMSVSYYEWVGPAGNPPQFTSAQRSNQNSRLYGTWVNENNSNTLMFSAPNVFHEEGGTTVVGGRNTFEYSFDGVTLTINQGNDQSLTKVNINGDVLAMGPFEGGNDWHYNLFLWGTFRKTQ